MTMTASRIIFGFTVVIVLINPPMVLGLLGERGFMAGQVIEANLGTDTLREKIFRKR